MKIFGSAVLYNYTLNCVYSNRFQRKNMILGALWFSKDKPTMTTYLKPLMTSINELSYEGTYTCTKLIIIFITHLLSGGGTLILCH